ncbi:PLP-dependent aminotransferase family protein [Burkholderia dolosa]|uniref:PLP-dependent aminotransferase family protein n=1 Tax=Burkholderia dolosa TaxID=152500 RepID=A0A892IBM8_9BURK|nr:MULTISPECIES: PLP-dependent aminotransferase family protein [Burkholderia]AKE05835.1 DNA-binding protein [Burkholderia cepacia]AJY09246.1 aminotransferase class I and II family protein [Burkholderia dolosa AU0158]AYZ93831.1 PLP-dependent aminotransferase family protein [Burkholderia dolosa]EAY70437.1 Transcriptional regulator [Burkholderia dolosa AU0158]ETP62434.1 DNA-binding protein [Burkholderia dolosa PC543]
MDIAIRIEGRHDLTGQIYRQLRTAIVDGRLEGGARLPSTRDLATQLGVSRKTTLDAFERLVAEGFLNTRAGNGTFVADGLARVPHASPTSAPSLVEDTPRIDAVDVRALWNDLPDALAMPAPQHTPGFDFRGGVTDKTLFPFDAWRRCLHHALRQQARGRGQYHDPAGDPQLRGAIARYVAFSRAVACGWDDVLVTQGAQQALDLIARVVVRPGDVVAVEDPGYPPARAAFASLGATVVGVPVDAQGIVTERLPDDARVVYVTPSHQFPLGMPMSLERRVALLEWAQRRRAAIIEDDYDGEFRFEGRPVESLKSLDRTGLVVYVGTFSKTIFPELRIGYAIPPRALRGALAKAKQIVDWHTCTLTQAALARFMVEGDFARHLRRVQKHYAARRKMLLAHLHGALARWFDPIVPTAGIHLAARLKPGLDEAALVRAARTHDIGLYGISAFHVGVPVRPGLLFGYGGIDAVRIDAALAKLAALLDAGAGTGAAASVVT